MLYLIRSGLTLSRRRVPFPWWSKAIVSISRSRFRDKDDGKRIPASAMRLWGKLVLNWMRYALISLPRGNRFHFHCLPSAIGRSHRIDAFFYNYVTITTIGFRSHTTLALMKIDFHCCADIQTRRGAERLDSHRSWIGFGINRKTLLFHSIFISIKCFFVPFNGHGLIHLQHISVFNAPHKNMILFLTFALWKH